MKTLLLNGSPRPNGNTASLIRELKSQKSSKSLLSILASHPVSTAVVAGKQPNVWYTMGWM